jgi:membrane-bound metal-dependent hydrolase YbcI (DUF457 family)
MDILTHIISGTAAGTVVAAFTPKSRKYRIATIVSGSFGGFFPDLDVISMWSGFDSTIGRLFNLQHTGKEIFDAQLWYSHHGFLHSFAGSIIVALLIGITIFLFRDGGHKKLSTKAFTASVSKHKEWLLAFIAGFVIHSIEDMPTPSGGWEGVNFWWPVSTYTGGTGEIWWWNNYDIFLIVSAITGINLLLLFFVKKIALRKITLVVFIAGMGLTLYQVKTRGFNCNKYKRRGVCERMSKQKQKDIIGDNLYLLMDKFDKLIPVAF